MEVGVRLYTDNLNEECVMANCSLSCSMWFLGILQITVPEQQLNRHQELEALGVNQR